MAAEAVITADRTSERSEARVAAFGLAAVLVVAAAIRIAYIGYGLPGTTYVDAFRFVDEAHDMAHAVGHWEPRDFMYPGLLKILLAWIYGAFGVESRTWLHLVPRLLATSFDLGSIAVVFALARRMIDVRGAMIAASLHAVSIVAVTSSRVETADSALAFFLIAGLALMALPRLRLIHFVVAGLVVGLATGTKYSGVYGCLSLAFGAWRARRQGWPVLAAIGGVALALALAVGAFLATTPWFLPLFDAYRRAIAVLVESERYGQIGHVQASFFDYLVSSTPTPEQPWLSSSLLGNLGPLVLIAAIAAVGVALFGKLGESGRLTAIYVVVYYLVVARTGHVKAIRYLCPAMPAIAALAGAGVARASELAPRSRRALAQAVMALALLAYPAWRTLGYVAKCAKPMTNDVALAWAKDNLPRGAGVLLSPFYLDNLRQLDVRVFNLANAAAVQYRLKSTIGVDTEERPLFRPELVPEMRPAGIEYVVLNSYFEGALKDTAENRRSFPKTVAAYQAFRDELARGADLLWSIDAAADGRIGPDIAVYRLRAEVPSPSASP